MDLIGMTNLQEAKLAREAEICYATIAMVTDYDCWHEEEEVVTVEMLIQYLTKNSKQAKALIGKAVELLPPDFTCSCQDALRNAVITDPAVIPEETRRRLDIILSKYMK